MAKSRARFLAELLGTDGLVKKAKSALAGADEVIDLSALPSIPNSKLTNSSITINSSATSLGGSVTLTTANVAENTNLYYTDARADARITAADTGDLSEGSNLYYTDARADARVNLQTGSNLNLSSKDTGDLSEGSNLYYTNARADARIAAADTGDLSEGSNLYYTNARADARVNLQTGSNLNLSSKDTGDLSEGSNLYYTNARADARIAAASTSDLSEGSNLYYTDARADARVALIVDSAPGTLNTLNELAAALGDDANFSTTVTNSIAAKLPLAGGTLTGDLILGDSIKLELGAGTGGDLQLYHDGSHSYVTNTYASGALKLVSDDFRIENASNRNQLKTGVSGAVQLFFDDGSATGLRLGTTAAGVDVTGNIVVSGTVDGVDIAARDAVLTSTTTTANAALPKAGGTMSGALNMGSQNITNIANLTSPSGSPLVLTGDSGANIELYGSGGSNNIYMDAAQVNYRGTNGSGAGSIAIGTTVVIDGSRNLTNIGTISSGAITTSGNVSVGGSAYTTSADLNLLGDGLSIKNDKAGNSNNWSLIQNTDTGSASNLSFTTGLGVALTLNHDKSATFDGAISSGSIVVSGKSQADTYQFTQNSSAVGATEAIYRATTGTIAIKTNSAERMRITSTGEIVTGGLTSSTGQLHLYKADATGGKLVLQSQVASDATAKITMMSRLLDNTNKNAYIEAYRGNINFGGDAGYGNVGIGTATPGYLLTVKKDVDAFAVKIENDKFWVYSSGKRTEVQGRTVNDFDFEITEGLAEGQTVSTYFPGEVP